MAGIRLRIAVGLLVRKDQVWIQQRPASVHLGGNWEFPGGKAEEEEPLFNALRRELQEEVGLHVEAAHTRLLWVRPFDYPDRDLKISFFLVFLPALQVPSGPGRWCDLAKVGEYPFPAANKPVLDWLEGWSG